MSLTHCKYCGSPLPPKKPGKGRPREKCESGCRAPGNPRSKESSCAYSKKYKDQMRAVLWEAKSVPCMDCGVSYPPPVMDLDHVRGKKLFAPSQIERFKAVPGKTRMEMLVEEIAKCDVRCATCHRLRHYYQDC